MIKNVMSLIAVVFILATVSCKKKEDFPVMALDANNNVVALNRVDSSTPEVISNKKPEEYPVLALENSSFDFGDIKQGDKVEHVFKFTNTGKIGDLLIINVQPSCGCTAPEWTKVPVKQGESGEIKIIFNTAGKSGLQQKSIMITTNTQKGSEVINFTANILTK
jgi:hypothetical protein